MIGDFIAMLTLFAWTGYFIAAKRARAHVAPIDFTTNVTIVALAVTWPAAALSGQDLGWPSAHHWIYIAVLAVGSGVAGHFLLGFAVPHLALWTASVLALVIPVVSVLGAWLLLSESIAFWQGVGIGLVLIAVGAASAPARRPARASGLAT